MGLTKLFNMGFIDRGYGSGMRTGELVGKELLKL